MWSSTVCLLAWIAKLISAKPLPPHLGSDTGAVISTIPLNSFGDFNTVTLKEASSNPGLFEHNDIIDAASLPTTFSGGGFSGFRAGLSAADTSDGASDTTKPATVAAATCASPRTRVEWRDYPPVDRQAFVDSIACLTQRPSAGATYAPSGSRYEDFVKTHQIFTPRVHGNGLFLPWHRYFLHVFEQALRTECGFNGTMPWWDETVENGRFAQSSIFTPEYFGSLPGPTDGRGTCIVDGKFANMTCHIGPGMDDIDHCLSRGVDEKMTAQASTAYVDYCAEQTAYGNFESCAETG